MNHVELILKLINDNDFSAQEGSKIIEELRIAMIFGDTEERMDDTITAKYHYLSGLAKMEDAQNTLRLAAVLCAQESG